MKNKNNEIIRRAKKKIIKKRFRIGENEKEIIKMIGLGVLVVSSLVLPNMALVIKPFINDRKDNELKKIWQRLIDKKVIDLGGEKVTLSSKGKEIYKEIQFHDLELIKPERWDGIWRLISYDVPQKQNHDRDNFRLTLKHWGFHQIQASLWVYPYECREEVAIAADFYQVAPFVIIMTTDVLPEEERIEEVFNL